MKVAGVKVIDGQKHYFISFFDDAGILIDRKEIPETDLKTIKKKQATEPHFLSRSE